MKKSMILTGLVAIALLAGCAGAPKQPVVGQQNVVERSAEKTPEWITVPFFEDEDIMYFSGGVRGVADYAVGLRQAKAEAVKNIAESIKTKARTEFVANTRGANLSPEDLGKFVQDGVAMVADNVEIGGMLPSESYTEKVEEITPTGVKYFYNCYSLYQMKVADYKEARARALNNLAQKAREENNKRAEEAANMLLERLQ